jgi:hypothetical protein
MAVVINEFETVPASPRTERGAESDSGSGGGEAPPQPTEHEIDKMMELHATRRERLRAY